jgi:hypothetical protein
MGFSSFGVWALEKGEWQSVWERITHPITLVVCCAISLIATVSGPFDTIHTMTTGTRLVFWVSVSFGTTLAAYAARTLTAMQVSKDRPVLFEACAIGLMVLFSTPLVMGLSFLLGDPKCGAVMACIDDFAFYVTLISTAIFLVRRMIPGFEELIFFAKDESGGLQLIAPSPIDLEPAVPPGPPRLYRRLPDGTRGEILHLTANGHFVDVTLSTGVEQIRMRFADAVDEMDSVEGYCSHRSHWVARAAVCGHGRVDGKPVLVLVNGMEVPVSRTYRSGLEDAGLLPISRASA